MANRADAVQQTAAPQSAEQENNKQWARVVAQAWADDDFKQRLTASPAAVLRENGFNVPPGIDVRIVENTDQVAYLTLPPKPAAELTESQLESVVGGFCCCSTCVTTTAPTTTTSSSTLTCRKAGGDQVE